MSHKLPISLCMIAKNEEQFIGTALESVRAVLNLDEMIVVDTGSEDRTKDIALDNGARVLDFTWCDDFAAARNFAAEKAKNDWILALDADEEVIGADLRELHLFTRDSHKVGTVTVVEMHDKSTYPISRLYSRVRYAFSGIIHEQVRPTSGNRKVIKNSSIQMLHYGYAPEFMEAKRKLGRNEELLLKALADAPDDPYLLYQLGKCYYSDNSNMAQACLSFEKALSSSPDYRLEYVHSLVECCGYALINTGQYEKALRLVEKYTRHYGRTPQFRFLTAHVLQNNGMFIEAVEHYESCIGANAVDYKGITSFLSYYNMGVVLECVGMVEDAVQMYGKCGDYAPALTRLGELGMGNDELQTPNS